MLETFQQTPIMEGFEILNVFIDASIMLETIIDRNILNKCDFKDSFNKALQEQIEQVESIYATLEYSSPVKYEMGIVLQDLKSQQDRIFRYEHAKKRKSQSYRAKEEAYSFPEIAALAECTKDGLKTRNKYYKR